MPFVAGRTSDQCNDGLRDRVSLRRMVENLAERDEKEIQWMQHTLLDLKAKVEETNQRR